VKVVLVAALLLASVLSGCSGKGSDAKDDHGSTAAAPVLYLNVTAGNQTYRYTSAMAGSGTTSGSVSLGASATGSATGSTSGSASHSHSGSAGASLNATKGKGNATVSGPAPLNVTVTLGATGLAAGKAFNWTLDFGDGKASSANPSVSASLSASGSSSASSTGSVSATASGHASHNATKPGTETGSKLPATVKHSYATAGNHTLRFSVSPTGGTPAHLEAKVQATAPANATGNASSGIAPGTVLGTIVLDESGTLTAAVQGLSCDSAQGVAADASFPWTFPANDTNGTPAVVGHVLIVLSQGDTAFDASLHFIGPDGTTIQSADDNSAGGDPSETLDADGPFEAGAYTVKVVGCVAANGDFTVHGEATLVAT
jgi:hypothetical protein